MPMNEPPELWVYVLSNVVLLLLGGLLTALSYRAYRRLDHAPLRYAAIGFGVITLGAVVEAIYELGIRGSYDLTGREMLALHTVEGFLIAIGLGIIFLSVHNY